MLLVHGLSGSSLYSRIDLILVMILSYIRALEVRFQAKFDVVIDIDVDGDAVIIGGESPLDENGAVSTSWGVLDSKIEFLTP